MHDAAILQTIHELEKWEKRRDEIIKEIKFCDGEIKDEKKKELSKVDEQITYYRKLLAEMKKEIKPVRISDVFDSLR